LQWVKKYKNWTSDDWKKAMFTDETNLSVQGYRKTAVWRSQADPIRIGHL